MGSPTKGGGSLGSPSFLQGGLHLADADTRVLSSVSRGQTEAQGHWQPVTWRPGPWYSGNLTGCAHIHVHTHTQPLALSFLFPGKLPPRCEQPPSICTQPHYQAGAMETTALPTGPLSLPSHQLLAAGFPAAGGGTSPRWGASCLCHRFPFIPRLCPGWESLV